MLIQMFFYVLMLMGIAALTIDMGYVRLTQSLMQNAADSAALEGLRQRDLQPVAYDGAKTYSACDVVSFSGQSWVSLQNANLGNQPDTSPAWWQQMDANAVRRALAGCMINQA